MSGKFTKLIAAVAAAASAVGAAKWVRGRKSADEPQLEVSASELPADEGVASEPAPASAASSGAGLDDLTAIKGLGKVKAAKLVAVGVTSYAQIATWTDDDIAEMGLTCNTSPGQIKREDWVGQAKALAEG